VKDDSAIEHVCFVPDFTSKRDHKDAGRGLLGASASVDHRRRRPTTHVESFNGSFGVVRGSQKLLLDPSWTLRELRSKPSVSEWLGRSIPTASAERTLSSLALRLLAARLPQSMLRSDLLATKVSEDCSSREKYLLESGNKGRLAKFSHVVRTKVTGKTLEIEAWRAGYYYLSVSSMAVMCSTCV
jgi:hypothetical protein